MRYRVILEQNEEGFCVTVPGLPGCVSQGTTREAAVANIREAIDGYIEVLKEDGLPVPEEKFDALIVAVRASCRACLGKRL